MLLTLTTTHQPASDLGFLLHKHPDRVQSFDLSFGRALVFYPQATEDSCTACLLLDVDPVGLVRGKNRSQAELLGRYVNDRPYVSSSLMSVAIAQVLRSAMAGICKDRPELAESPIALQARLDVLPVRGGERFLHELFEPLGYRVTAQRHPLDEKFPEWGESPYYSVTLEATVKLADLLSHLYVLIPVFDNEKHYYVGEAEVEKLLAKGEGWLASHPAKDFITSRYLRFRHSLTHQALARLIEQDPDDTEEADNQDNELTPEQKERKETLNQQRLAAVLETLKASGASSVLDLGCGEGKLLRELLGEHQFQRIVGMDVSTRVLEIAERRLKLDRMPEAKANRLKLLHGSLIYRDKRLKGFDAAALVEVIEHLDPPRLSALERALFEFSQPKTIVLTTPNREYNVMWETLPAGQLRHGDHRFEWTRQEFQEWANGVADRYGYAVKFLPVGPEDDEVGSPTQMGVFERASDEENHDG